jgi:hypothetical protein
MSNGYFLADTNSLVYAYRAGGTDLLDMYLDTAKEQDRKFAITKTVEREIEKGPLGKDLLQYFADKQIPVLSAPETEQKLRTGQITRISAGEVSMLEVATQESAANRVTRIWSDDQYFDSPQIMRNHPDVHRSMSAQLLDEMFEQKFIGVAEHQTFRAGYQAQLVFIDSQRLSTFRYDFSSPDIDAPNSRGMKLGGGSAAVVGAAVEAYQWNETLGQANTFRNTLGNNTAADEVLLRQSASSTSALAGGAMGTGLAAGLGLGSGGTFVLVTAEAYFVSAVADKAVTMWQHEKIYTQEDAGVEWKFNGQQWLSDGVRGISVS